MERIVLEQCISPLRIALNGILLVTEDKSIGGGDLRANNIFDIAVSMETTRLNL